MSFPVSRKDELEHSFRKLEQAVARLQRPPQEAWRYIGGTSQPVFTGTWVNLGFGTTPAAFRMDRSRVSLAGIVTGDNLGNPFWTMPVEYRPSATTWSVGFLSDIVGNIYMNSIRIDTNGVVTPSTNPQSLPGGMSYWIFSMLDGLSSYQINPPTP